MRQQNSVLKELAHSGAVTKNNTPNHHRRVTTPTLSAQVLLLALLLTIPVVGQGRPAEAGMQGDGNLKVMTYNTYVGAEFVGVTDPDLANFLQAITNLILEARASDPPARARAVARLIAANKPHLVSLQEVATWSTGPSPENLTVEFDYLQLLLNALAAQGVPYTPVATLTHFDVTMPSSLGLYVRNTWRVAVIARGNLKPDAFPFTNIQSANWTNTLIVPIPALGIQLPFPRGWISADVAYRGKQFRFIAAHLDSSSATREKAQGLELLNGPANTGLPVIVAADLNADCANPSDTTYPTCINFSNAGFTDAWTAAHPFEPGYTKHVPVMTERSDYVMIRDLFGVTAAALVGEEIGDRTPAGLYPSDHAGVVVRLNRHEEK